MKPLTYTLGEVLLGHTPKPVPVHKENLCACKYGIVKEGHLVCKNCFDNEQELLQAVHDIR